MPHRVRGHAQSRPAVGLDQRPTLPMTARCTSATNPVAPGTASVIPPSLTHPQFMARRRKTVRYRRRTATAWVALVGVSQASLMRPPG